MAATENALTIHNDIPMELPELPPNQGLEAFKDIVFGSVSHPSTCVSSVHCFFLAGTKSLLSPGRGNDRQSY